MGRDGPNRDEEFPSRVPSREFLTGRDGTGYTIFSSNPAGIGTGSGRDRDGTGLTGICAHP